jgi:hypothetical protein
MLNPASYDQLPLACRLAANANLGFQAGSIRVVPRRDGLPGPVQEIEQPAETRNIGKSDLSLGSSLNFPANEAADSDGCCFFVRRADVLSSRSKFQILPPERMPADLMRDDDPQERAIAS